MTDPKPDVKKKRSKAKTAGIVVGVVIALLIVGGFGWQYYRDVINWEASAPNSIQVSGEISTTGTGTQPVRITFVENGGARYSDTVSREGNYFYSVNLPNGNYGYNIEIDWQGIGGAQGTCGAGHMSYTTQKSATMSDRNYQC